MTDALYLFVGPDWPKAERFTDAAALGARLHQLRGRRGLDMTPARSIAFDDLFFEQGVTVRATAKDADPEHLAVVAGPGVDTVEALTALLHRTKPARKAA